MSDEENVRRPRRGKRSALASESSSGSESDCVAEVVNKRKKMNVIESESSSDGSSDDSVLAGRISRPTKKRPRVSSENESSSSEESNDESSEESSSEESHSQVTATPRRTRGRIRAGSGEESTSMDSDSEETSSESGQSSVGSFESYDNTDDEAMVQAAIQESLASVAKNSEPKNDAAAKENAPVIAESGGFASDSSDGQSEKCPICLISFTNQEIGSPETCDHTFCSLCIQEWAKNVNTCPVDRQVFSLILVRKELNGKVIKKIPISNREVREPQESDSDPTFCEVCGRSDREDRLLLCDGCDLGYHLECLNPPMENVPIEEWFCAECAADHPSRLAEEIDMQEGELFDLLDDMVQIRPRSSRLLPRTRQSERVRATLRSLHQELLQRTHEPALQQPSTSGIESVGADSSSVGSGARATVASASTVRRRKVVRRKTVKKRRRKLTTKRTTKKKPVRRKIKVIKKATMSGDEDLEEIEEYVPKKKRKVGRKKWKIHRKKKISRRKTARTATPRSVKGRLAEQLGLCAPSRPGISLPVVRSRATTYDIDLQRSRAGIPTLHIYGPQNELDYFSSDNEDVVNEGGSVAVATRPRLAHPAAGRLLARKKLSAAALQSHRAVPTPKPIRNKVQVEESVPPSTAPVDLIGSILDSQAIWHSKTSSVTIKPDGSLEVSKDPGRTSVANTQGTVVCDSVSDKNKTDGSLVRSDDRLSEVTGSSTSSVDLGSATARITQAPLYPGRGDNSNRPPASSGFHQFGGPRYSAPSYSSYQGGREFSSFSSSGSNFDANSTRAGYSNYLNSGLPPAPMRNTPVRFRVTPRYPLRRNQGSQRSQDQPPKNEDRKTDEAGEGNQKPLEEEEDDEIDIYSDIEAGGGGSGGPSAGGSEQDEAERGMETSYEALPPPPEPSALLMGFGEQLLSEEEPTSDSELVIDDNGGPQSPRDQNESGLQIPESEKYDPAEPLADSDDDEPDSLENRDSDDDDEIPLPPCPPANMPFPPSTNMSQHIINSSSNSNASYLHSPTYGETSFETDKLSTVTDNGVVNNVVKEVITERLKSSPAIISVSHGSSARPSVRRDEEDECPNFSIYSATSMDIARSTGDETTATDAKADNEKTSHHSEDELKTEKEIEETDGKSEKANSDSEDKSKTLDLSEARSLSSSPDIKQVSEGKDKKDEEEDTDKDHDDTDDDKSEHDKDEDKEDQEDKVNASDEVDKTDQSEENNVEDPHGHKENESETSSLIGDSWSEKHDSDGEGKNSKEIDVTKVDICDVENKESLDVERQLPSPSSSDKETESNTEKNSQKISLTEHSRRKSLTEDARRKSLSEDGRRKSLLDDDRRKSLSEGDRRKSLSEDGRRKSLSEDGRRKSLSEDGRRKSLSEDGRRKSLSEHGRRKSLSEHGRRKSLSEDGRRKSLSEDGRRKSLSEDGRRKSLSEDGRRKSLSEDGRRTSLSEDGRRKSLSEDGRKTSLTEDTVDSDDNGSLIGYPESTASVAAARGINPPAPSGLEGLDTETISETEEAINFDDISQDGNELVSAEEDGEISSSKKKRKKKNHRTLDEDGKILNDLSRKVVVEREQTPEEGEIVDDRPKLLLIDIPKRDKKPVEKKDSSRPEKEALKVSDENFDVSKPKDDDKKKKKKDKRKSSEKVEERAVLGSSENKRKSKEKSRRSEEPNISWKKPSKNTKERNYRDTKTSKPDDSSKDKDKDDDGKDTSKKKKKEKRKDMERYDVRKIVSDKRRRRKDEFGRDLSRDRSCSRTRSRSRSHRRSRSVSKSRRHRSPARTRRSRSRSRYRSRSRSYRRSRSKSKNRSRRKSKEKARRSRSKDRQRGRSSRSRSRGRRSRSRSASHSRSKNKARLRSRSRSPVKQRKERTDRSHVVREVPRFRTRRSWSRTWTPSWSRSRSQSISCSSFTHSRSPSVRHFNRSFSRSFSRSWSRERYERIPLEKTGALSNKAPKKLTVIVSNTKENADRQKKEKKKKKEKKLKEVLGTLEKRKKRKEKSPAPSKEVFTSGDNILVSVNFNKSSKTAASKDVSSASISTLPKDAIKRKREETFEVDREIGKKMRKEKNKDKNKGVPNEKGALGLQTEKKTKKQAGRGNKSARIAAILKQKPVAIIDLDQSPFREQTPSPRDLIVLSDSDEDARNKEMEHEEIVESLSVCRGLRPDSTSPQSPAKGVHNVPTGISISRSPESELKLLSAVSNYLNSSTGPKTPPEPQIKFSIASKQAPLRVINNPLQEEDDILPEDAGLDDSDQRIEEELDRNLGEILHKGPNTPPEPRGPTTPCSPPTSPDAYDPFDPTKSGTPSPAGPEASMDGPPSPPRTPADELQIGNAVGSAGRDSPIPSDLEDLVNKNAEARNKSPPMQSTEEVTEEPRVSPKGVAREAKSPAGISEAIALTPQRQNEEIPSVAEISEVSKSSHGLPSNITSVSIVEGSTKSPERKIGVVITTQSKLQSTPIKTPVFPVPSLKQVPASQQSMTSTPSHAAPPPIFPSLTPVNIASMLCTSTANLGLSRTTIFTPPAPLSVPSLLQHVSNTVTPVQVRMPLDKPAVPAVPIRSLVQNGEQLPKPQDTTTEVVDMDLDSPYSPGSSEGDDLFDPPADTPTRSGQPVHSVERPKTNQQPAKNANKLSVPASNLPSHKSPSKSQDKFDSLFVGSAGAPVKAGKPARSKGHKGAKSKTKHVKGGKKEIAIKMDEDQLQILDELPSSAVELQVKDKFLKKLNRQERVVEEVKLSLKPHYNRKHISKDEYKDILRKSVPKICHNKSGEINPVKIATLVEAYVKKVRYEKKKSASSSSGTNTTPAKAKAAKTTKWS